MAEFRVSRAAHGDILEIGSFTEREWGIHQRREYLDGLDAQFTLISENPMLAAERREFTPPVRIHPYRRHLIVYLAEPDGIFIVRVLHAGMDVASRLGG